MRICQIAISGTFAAGLAALPISAAQAQYYPPCSPFPLFWPFCVAGALVGAAATIITAPFWALTGTPPRNCRQFTRYRNTLRVSVDPVGEPAASPISSDSPLERDGGRPTPIIAEICIDTPQPRREPAATLAKKRAVAQLLWNCRTGKCGCDCFVREGDGHDNRFSVSIPVRLS
jgi:hypothetical protein